MNDTIPIFNLKAVIKETGLSPATLRAWERRYGLIKPQRSPGGHRLYSRQDIDLLKWLIARQQEGLSISQAVGMWRVQLDRAPREPIRVETLPAIPRAGESILVELRQRWLAACQSFDDSAANQVIDQAFAITIPEMVCIEIFLKGLAEIGQNWYSGKCSEQQEHFISAIAMRRLNALFTALPAASRPETILAACPPGEVHDFILLVITYLLRRRGWNVRFIGSNVPLDHLDRTINSIKPALVLSAAQTLPGAASLGEMSQVLVSLGIPMGYGGGIFRLVPDAASYISGYYLGTILPALPGIIELLITAPPAMSKSRTRLTEYSITLERFKGRESVISASVASFMSTLQTGRKEIELANGYLNQTIESALRLGNIQLADHIRTWLDGFLAYRGVSDSIVGQYYQAYRQAVEVELGEEGNLIIEWLRNTKSDIS